MFAHQLGLPRITGIIRCHSREVAILGVVEGVRGPVEIEKHLGRAALEGYGTPVPKVRYRKQCCACQKG